MDFSYICVSLAQYCRSFHPMIFHIDGLMGMPVIFINAMPSRNITYGGRSMEREKRNGSMAGALVAMAHVIRVTFYRLKMIFGNLNMFTLNYRRH